MKPIDTKTHGYLDYIMGIFLVAAPSLFSFEMNAMQSYVFYIAGIAAIVYSLLTSYELGMIKIIPMKIHLVLDLMSGIFLALSPWIFHFSDQVYVPHLILGIIEILAAVLTNSRPAVAIKA